MRVEAGVGVGVRVRVEVMVRVRVRWVVRLGRILDLIHAT